MSSLFDIESTTQRQEKTKGYRQLDFSRYRKNKAGGSNLANAVSPPPVDPLSKYPPQEQERIKTFSEKEPFKKEYLAGDTEIIGEPAEPEPFSKRLTGAFTGVQEQFKAKIAETKETSGQIQSLRQELSQLPFGQPGTQERAQEIASQIDTLSTQKPQKPMQRISAIGSQVDIAPFEERARVEKERQKLTPGIQQKEKEVQQIEAKEQALNAKFQKLGVNFDDVVEGNIPFRKQLTLPAQEMAKLSQQARDLRNKKILKQRELSSSQEELDIEVRGGIKDVGELSAIRSAQEKLEVGVLQTSIGETNFKPSNLTDAEFKAYFNRNRTSEEQRKADPKDIDAHEVVTEKIRLGRESKNIMFKAIEEKNPVKFGKSMVGALGAVFSSLELPAEIIVTKVGKDAIPAAIDQLEPIKQEQLANTIQKASDYYDTLNPENKVLVKGTFELAFADVLKKGRGVSAGALKKMDVDQFGKNLKGISESITESTKRAIPKIREGTEGIIKAGKKELPGVIEKGKRVAKEAFAENKTAKEAFDVLGEVKVKKLESQVEDLAGKIVQGDPKDKVVAARALKQMDITDVKTFDDLNKTATANISALAKAQDKVLGEATEKIPLNKLGTITTTKRGTKIKQNFVNDAFADLDEFYSKTNNLEGLGELRDIRKIADSEGLTAKEINQLAREYNSNIAKMKAFSQSGKAKVSMTAQGVENTRKGLKAKSASVLGSDAARAIDAQMSDLYTVQRLTRKMAKDVNHLSQQVSKRGIIERVARMTGRAFNFSTANAPRGFFQSFFQGNVGIKKMNSLAIQETLEGNLKKLQKLSRKIDKFDTIKTTSKQKKVANEIIDQLDEVMQLKAAPETKLLPAGKVSANPKASTVGKKTVSKTKKLSDAAKEQIDKLTKDLSNRENALAQQIQSEELGIVKELSIKRKSKESGAIFRIKERIKHIKESGLSTAESSDKSFRGFGDDIAKSKVAQKASTAGLTTPKVTKKVSDTIPKDLEPLAKEARKIQDVLKSKYKDVGLSITEDQNRIILNKIVVPVKQQGKGTGSKVMKDLINHANKTNKIIGATPGTEFGATSKKRLIKFYKRLGFQQNKGRSKDFTISETFIRYPDE